MPPALVGAGNRLRFCTESPRKRGFSTPPETCGSEAKAKTALVQSSIPGREDNKKGAQGVHSIKQVLPAERQKEYEHFVRTPFAYCRVVA